MKKHIRFEIDIEVSDAAAFVAAARALAIEEGVDEDDVAETYNEENLAACAVMLLDRRIPGADILGSSARELAS